MTLDDAIQLHEMLSVWYRVDGYVAELMTADGSKIVLTAIGDTPDEAIEELKQKLSSVPNLKALRALAATST